MAESGGAKLYFSDCPPVPGAAEPLPPHQALEFTVGSGGALEGRYVAARASDSAFVGIHHPDGSCDSCADLCGAGLCVGSTRNVLGEVVDNDWCVFPGKQNKSTCCDGGVRKCLLILLKELTMSLWSEAA